MVMSPEQSAAPSKKEFVCTFCQRAFGRLEHLKRHERSHTNEKPFQCPICNATFVRRDMLKRHLKNVHKDIDTNELVIKSDTFKIVEPTAETAHSAKPVIISQKTESPESPESSSSPQSSSAIVSNPPAPAVSVVNTTTNSTNADNALKAKENSEEKPALVATNQEQLLTTAKTTTPVLASSLASSKRKTSSKPQTQNTNSLDLDFINSSALLNNQQLQDLQLQTSPLLHYLNVVNLYQNLSITSNLHHLMEIKTQDFIKILINFAIESLHFGNYEDLLRLLVKLNELPLNLNHLLFLNAVVSNKTFHNADEEIRGSLSHLISSNVNTLMNKLQNLVGLEDIDNIKLIEVYKILSYYKLNHPNKFNFELKYKYFIENFQEIFKFDFLEELEQMPNPDNVNGSNLNLQEILLLTLSNEFFYRFVISEGKYVLSHLANLQELMASNAAAITVSNDQNILNLEEIIKGSLLSSFPHFEQVISLTFENELVWKIYFNFISNINDASRMTLSLKANEKQEIFENLCASIIIQTQSSSTTVINNIYKFEGLINLCLTELSKKLKNERSTFSDNFPLLDQILKLLISSSSYYLQFIQELSSKIQAVSKALPQSLVYNHRLTIPYSLHKVLSSNLKYTTPYISSKRPSSSSKSSKTKSCKEGKSSSNDREKKDSRVEPDTKRIKLDERSASTSPSFSQDAKTRTKFEPPQSQLLLPSHIVSNQTSAQINDQNYTLKTVDTFKLPSLDTILPRNLLELSNAIAPHPNNHSLSSSTPSMKTYGLSHHHNYHNLTPSPPVSSTRSTVMVSSASNFQNGTSLVGLATVTQHSPVVDQQLIRKDSDDSTISSNSNSNNGNGNGNVSGGEDLQRYKY